MTHRPAVRSKVLLRTLVAALCCGASVAADEPVAALAEWTVMVYISGDNDLEQYVVKDIERELAAVGSTPQVQVVALADRGPGRSPSRGDWQSTLLFHVTPGLKANARSAVADWGERNFGAPQTLVDFVTWTKTHYPARRYALFLWGHGWTWHLGHALEDETDADTLDPSELAAILPQIGPFEVVGYDGCNSASLETALLWRGHAKAMAASQEFVNWDGIEYDEVLRALNERPEMSADEVAMVCSQSATLDHTFSSIALDARLDRVTAAVDALAKVLLAGFDEHHAEIRAAIRESRAFQKAPTDRDLYSVASELLARVKEPGIVAASREVMDAVQAAVLHERHSETYSRAHGMTIYLAFRPAQLPEDHAAYAATRLARETAWDDLIERCLQRLEVTTEP
jgi:hypothetical protein